MHYLNSLSAKQPSSALEKYTVKTTKELMEKKTLDLSKKRSLLKMHDG